MLQIWKFALHSLMFQTAFMSLLAMQVYLILDEFLMGGEVQETSKKVGSSSL